MNIKHAIRCFEENLAMAGTEREKYNLYNGLVQMARAIEDLAAKVQAIKNTVEQLQR